MQFFVFYRCVLMATLCRPDGVGMIPIPESNHDRILAAMAETALMLPQVGSQWSGDPLADAERRIAVFQKALLFLQEAHNLLGSDVAPSQFVYRRRLTPAGCQFDKLNDVFPSRSQTLSR